VAPERPASATRTRILAASAELMRRHGYAGTGIKAILAASGTPYGSLYHHFPGGKEQVGVETVREGGRAYLALVESYFAPGVDVADATGRFFDDAAAFVESTAFVDACPIATIAGEIADTSEPMRAAAAEAFRSWMAVVEARLTDAGIDAARSEELAVELFCFIEGAFLLARTLRTAEPVRAVGRRAQQAVGAALATAAERAV
jgi:AcrR family transcriptional regulator